MQIKYFGLIFGLIFLCSCQHLSALLKPLWLLKMAIEGELKGVPINCEKILSPKEDWQVMCAIGDNIEVKYRTKRLDNKNTQLEVIIDKTKGDKRKIIAEPILIVNREQPTIREIVSSKNQLKIRAELVR